jgi:hypothetical protein
MFHLCSYAARTITTMKTLSNTQLILAEATSVASVPACPHSFGTGRRQAYGQALSGGYAR